MPQLLLVHRAGPGRGEADAVDLEDRRPDRRRPSQRLDHADRHGAAGGGAIAGQFGVGAPHVERPDGVRAAPASPAIARCHRKISAIDGAMRRRLDHIGHGRSSTSSSTCDSGSRRRRRSAARPRARTARQRSATARGASTSGPSASRHGAPVCVTSEQRREHLLPLGIHPHADARPVRRPRRRRRASASSADTPTTGRPVANASPWMAAMPMRRPVKDPGPAATANTSTSPRPGGRARSSNVRMSPGSRSRVRRQRIADAGSPPRVPSRSEGHAAEPVGGVESENEHEEIVPQSRAGMLYSERRVQPGSIGLAKGHGERHAGHAPVPRRQAAVPRRDRLLPHGRLLRDVLRGRAGRGARPRPDADLAIEGRRRRRHPDVRRAVPRRRRLPRAAGQEGLPRRHLRAGRGPEEGQGPGPREVVRVVSPGTLHRRRLPRRARAGVPDGGRAVGWPDAASADRLARRPPRHLRRGAARSVHRRVPDRRVSRAGRPAGAGRRARACCGRARSSCPASSTLRRPAAEVARAALPVTRVDGWTFDLEPRAARRCSSSCTRTRLEGFGLEGHPAAVQAAGALVHYLRDTQKADLAHVRSVTFRQHADRLLVDPMTLQAPRDRRGDGRRPRRLAARRDRSHGHADGRPAAAGVAAAPAGRRSSASAIGSTRVEEFAFRTTERGKFRDALKAVHDLERLVARAALGTAGPRDLVALRHVARGRAPRCGQLLGELPGAARPSLVAELDDLADVRDAIERTLIDEPPALARDGGFIRDGVDPELDELRRISRSGKQVIAEMEDAERARTGIASLKVRYNRVFGYYIEISKSNLHAVPADYHRKQTIAGGERFITPALKEYEEKVLGADERILERELELFEALRARGRRRGAAHPGHRARARRRSTCSPRWPRPPPLHNYTKPHVHDGDELHGRSTGGTRSSSATAADAFVPNDIAARRHGPAAGDPDRPEHGRQVHVPAADGAPLPAWRRPGRSCRRARPRSPSSIASSRASARPTTSRAASRRSWSRCRRPRTSCTRRTSRSLVVLDEIGRGTATFDGLSIAWAVAEHLATNPRARPEDAVRDALPRADRPGRRAARRRQLPRRRARVEGRHRLPAQGRRRAGPIAATASRSRGWPACPSEVIARARTILDALEQDAVARAAARPWPSPRGDPASSWACSRRRRRSTPSRDG